MGNILFMIYTEFSETSRAIDLISDEAANKIYYEVGHRGIKRPYTEVYCALLYLKFLLPQFLASHMDIYE